MLKTDVNFSDSWLPIGDHLHNLGLYHFISLLRCGVLSGNCSDRPLIHATSVTRLRWEVVMKRRVGRHFIPQMRSVERKLQRQAANIRNQCSTSQVGSSNKTQGWAPFPPQVQGDPCNWCCASQIGCTYLLFSRSFLLSKCARAVIRGSGGNGAKTPPVFQ